MKGLRDQVTGIISWDYLDEPILNYKPGDAPGDAQYIESEDYYQDNDKNPFHV
jgi:hypothetical protein